MNKTIELKKENIPSKYKYTLDRVFYEYKMTTSNLAFMIDKHLNDDNTDFLNSDIIKRLTNDCINAKLNMWVIINGIRIIMGIPEKAEINLDNNNTNYYFTW